MMPLGFPIAPPTFTGQAAVPKRPQKLGKFSLEFKNNGMNSGWKDCVYNVPLLKTPEVITTFRQNNQQPVDIFSPLYGELQTEADDSQPPPPSVVPKLNGIMPSNGRMYVVKLISDW